MKFKKWVFQIVFISAVAIAVLPTAVLPTATECHAQRFGQGYTIGQPRQSTVENVNVILVLGHSEATGGVAPEPGGFASHYLTSSEIEIYTKDDRTSADNGGFQLYNAHTNRFPGYGPPSDPGSGYTVGIDQSLVYEIGDNDNTLKKKIVLLKWALGGTTCMQRGGTPPNDWYYSSSAEMWQSFADWYFVPAMRDLHAAGYYNATVKAVIVDLGINDCITGVWNTATFNTAMLNMIVVLRGRIGNAAPIYWVRVKSDLASAPSGAYLAADVTACRGVIDSYEGIDIDLESIDIDALSTVADGVHRDATSNITVGEWMATRIKALKD